VAINLKLPKSKNKKVKQIKKSQIPTKNFINIQIKKKQSFNPRKNLPVIIIVVILLLVFCKFMVLDRIFGVTNLTDEVSNMKTELAQAEQQINSMTDMEDMYAHYTTSGMTEEELSLVDRTKVMKLVGKAFKEGAKARSWNLTGNILTLEVSGSSLSKLNKLASDLEENSIVERCVISSADKGRDEKGNVVVTFTVYLQQSDSSDNGGNK
jgi:cell division protein FtsL